MRVVEQGVYSYWRGGRHLLGSFALLLPLRKNCSGSPVVRGSGVRFKYVSSDCSDCNCGGFWDTRKASIREGDTIWGRGGTRLEHFFPPASSIDLRLIIQYYL